MKVIPILQGSLMIIGFIFVWIASTKRTEAHPYHSNADRVNLFKRQNWYTPMGYKLHVCGFVMIYFGLGLGVLSYTL